MNVPLRSPNKKRSSTRSSTRLSDARKVFIDYSTLANTGFQAPNLGVVIEDNDVPVLAEAVANPAAQAEVLHGSENEVERSPKRKRKNKKQRGHIEEVNLPAPLDLDVAAAIAENTTMELNNLIDEVTSYADEPQDQPKKKAKSKSGKKRKASIISTPMPETAAAPISVPKKLNFKRTKKGLDGSRMHQEALEQIQADKTDEAERKRIRKNTKTAKYTDDRRKEELEIYKQRPVNFNTTRKETDRVILMRIDEVETKQCHLDFYYNTDEENDLDDHGDDGDFEDIRGFQEYQGEHHFNPEMTYQASSSASTAAAPISSSSGDLTKAQRLKKFFII